ncbi:prepilin peptidase-dependent protein [Escherichia fergusonii]|uniref:prepilin peptidase-dependent protein n=1 Tax=Escherichia fergusonii TaxID=564 RepID=UPI0015F73784|nr:prepilin peptidase-dependent protein [Escherichia fergusonii]MBA5617250.1 prepilin peptidase-dependent protein [Escherichia fergusonii]MBA5665061.1 prepilin peptidase-dependent protein [Escherichia fergusonii]MBA8159476.1 prepilin peptidase-dependent protein [Escherichia fergusonii]MBA8172824.1 prepilin peptidase-dependent protein [Escherichia fergusonii]MBA8186419.1 prepilin peptidase-dependent protein [Escherichia fergusonii]
MKREQGYTLIEILVAMLIIALLSAGGVYGWQSWQQQQRLWQTACQLRDYLLYLREDANWHNRDHVISVIREGKSWCLVSSAVGQTTCMPASPLIFTPGWEEINLAEVTPALAFYGLRNTAWPGHIRLQNTAGEWQILISPWGRIRSCKPTQVESCR